MKGEAVPKFKKPDLTPQETSAALATNPSALFNTVNLIGSQKAEIAKLSVAVAAITKHLGISKPKSNVAPKVPQGPSYALHASKHTPNSAGNAAAPKPKPPAPPVHKKPELHTANSITLLQTSVDGQAFAKLTLREILHQINSLLAAKGIKVQDSDAEVIQL